MMDYRSFGDNKNTKGEVFNRQWWKSATLDELAGAIESTLSLICQYDAKRQTTYQMASRLYGNADLLGVNGVSYTQSPSTQYGLRDRISFNVIQSCVDTVTAKIAKNRPRPTFLTENGNYAQQRRAQKLTKFVEGVFYDNDIDEMAVDAFRYAGVLGDAIVHVYPDNGRVKFEKVLTRELFVDYLDGLMGKPRQMHRVKSVDRMVLAAKFPEHKSAIMDATETKTDLTGIYERVADQVPVIESWHLPSGKDATDGLHTIIIPGKVLLKEKYTHTRFPFAKLSWAPRLEGYWAQGIPEQIQNIQLEINKLLWVIQRSMHLSGTFKIFVENSSEIVSEHLSNDIGAIVSYTGQQPTYLTPPVVPPEIYAHVLRLKDFAYEQVGVSQLSATSQKPKGLDSGKALREYNDIESERFIITGQGFENFHLDLADLTIMVAKDIYAKDKNLSINVPGARFIETIKWKEVDLEADQYVMKAFPVSSLPSTPEGKLQTIQEYIQAGFYTPRVGKKLLDFPDMEAIDDLESAMEDHIEKVLDAIAEEGKYSAPEPDDNLQLAKQMVLEYIARGKRDNLDAANLDLLRRYNKQIDILLQKAMPPAPPMGAGLPGEGMGAAVPQGTPEAAPVSDLMPQVG